MENQNLENQNETKEVVTLEDIKSNLKTYIENLTEEEAKLVERISELKQEKKKAEKTLKTLD